MMFSKCTLLSINVSSLSFMMAAWYSLVLYTYISCIRSYAKAGIGHFQDLAIESSAAVNLGMQDHSNMTSLTLGKIHTREVGSWGGIFMFSFLSNLQIITNLWRLWGKRRSFTLLVIMKTSITITKISVK